MSERKDGGPAFPTSRMLGDGVITGGGVSIRDYFAAKAMQAMICADSDNGKFRDEDNIWRTTAFAYRVADMMIAERSK